MDGQGRRGKMANTMPKPPFLLLFLILLGAPSPLIMAFTLPSPSFSPSLPPAFPPSCFLCPLASSSLREIRPGRAARILGKISALLSVAPISLSLSLSVSLSVCDSFFLSARLSLCCSVLLSHLSLHSLHSPLLAIFMSIT